MASTSRMRIGIFTGGPSAEREISLKSAAHVLRSLDATRYDARIIEIDTHGEWADTAPMDLALIAMHGTFAEDGTLQTKLKELGIPYTGSNPIASALGMDKARAHERIAARGLSNPRSIVCTRDTPRIRAQIEQSFGFPCFIKPNASGSSVGMSLVDEPSALDAALATAFAECETVLVQERVRGREFSCGTLGNSGQTDILSLPVVEIITTARFFDYDAKYDASKTREVCPAEIDAALAARIQDAARIAHEALGCDGLTRSDFIASEDGTIYFLEINTIPGMTEASICPKEAAALGWSFADLLDKQIALALQRHAATHRTA